ncbi:MAG: HNH endonuclease [Cyclobacteriaceae bacterium]|nr:HNH endonuclease [Cyclobacteriaceae bacterium]UYN86782.1 MAG: HNH endonuclease [Cyclobacteriaceae bacterium]
MKEGQKLWTREELILTINLYCKLPFGKLHSRNPDVIELANLIDRTPGSVAFKLVNFASLDPQLKARGIKGASNVSNLDKEIWNEFFNNWDNLFIESENLYAKKKKITVDRLYEIDLTDLPISGEEKERMVKVRTNQVVFRTLVMANYDFSCCITGINQPELLIASHIKPWSQDSTNRLNPKNGLALNALHDKAFDKGLLTITEDYKIIISSILLKNDSTKSIKQNFIQFQNKQIILPKKFMPDPEFLKYHNHECFKK